MNIVARIKLSSKMKNFTSEIGYYSYTNTLACIKSERKKILQNLENVIF